MISQVVEFDFVLGSERFYCCVFFKLVLTTPFRFIEPTLLALERALLKQFGSSNNCVTVTFVRLTPGRSKLGRDVFADLTDVL